MKKVSHVHVFRHGARVIYIYHIYDKLNLKKLEENAKLINNNQARVTVTLFCCNLKQNPLNFECLETFNSHQIIFTVALKENQYMLS